jgi:integrase
MAVAEVQRLLDSCDRSSVVGLRNFAIMTLVARRGLRSVEVARLELGDVDWRAGELVVRGKGPRQDRLPLPVEVGEALVAARLVAELHQHITARRPSGSHDTLQTPLQYEKADRDQVKGMRSPPGFGRGTTGNPRGSFLFPRTLPVTAIYAAR